MREDRALLLIAAVAVALRCASALLQGDSVQALPGIADQVSYDELARRVVGGHGFTFAVNWWPATRAGQPTAHWSFLYTLYLAAVYSIVGWHPLAARLLQAIAVGVLYPLLAWRLGRRLFGGSVGLAAALLMSFYGYFIYYAGALMTESFFIVAVLWSLDIATSMATEHRSVTVRLWLQLGFALGVAVLLRQLLLLFVPFLFGWLIWPLALRPWLGLRKVYPRLRPVLFGVASSLAVIVVLILPWTARNYVAFHRVVLLNTNAGFAFYWANHPLQGTDFQAILPAPVYSTMIPPELLQLDEAALEAALFQRGIDFVLADPGRYVLLSVSRVKDYFKFWPSPESDPISNVARVSSYGVYLPLMLYGLLVTILHRSRPRAGQGISLVLIYLFGVVYTAIHVLTWTLIRYRLPLDAVLMPIAGLTVVGAIGVCRVEALLSRLRGTVATQTSLSSAAPRLSAPGGPEVR